MRTTEPLILTSTNELQFWGNGDAKDFRTWLHKARPDLDEPVQERLVHAAAAFLERYGETGRRAVHQDIASLQTWLTRDTDNLGTQKATSVAYALHAACRGFGYELAKVVMGAAPVKPDRENISGPAHSSGSKIPDNQYQEDLGQIALRNLERTIHAHVEALEVVEPESATVEEATRDIVANLRPATRVFIAGVLRQKDRTGNHYVHVPKEICTAEDTVVKALTARVRARHGDKR